VARAFDLVGITHQCPTDSSGEAKKMEQLSIFGLPNDYLITERRAMAL